MSFAPVFVVGVGRSGTSLVQSMLAAHSHLAFPPETQFVRRYVGRRRLARCHARGGVAAVRAMLEADSRVRRLQLDLEEVLARYRRGAPFSEADLYETLLTCYARTRRKPRVGDKDPRCVEYLPLLARHWPSAHVVHVIRDPRDVLASKKRAAWSRRRSPVTHVFVNRVHLRAGRRAGPLLFGPRYHEVVYEALLADPETVLRRLAKRIEVPYEEAMLRFGDAARSLVSDEELAWKRETLGPLLATNSGKWRRELADGEAALAERVCREGVMIVTRQTRPAPGTARAVQFKVRFVSAVLRVLEWPYRLYRWGSLVWLQRDEPA